MDTNKVELNKWIMKNQMRYDRLKLSKLIISNQNKVLWANRRQMN